MFKIITDRDEVRESQNILEASLAKILEMESDYTIGFPSGSWECPVKYNDSIWHTGYEIKDSSPRHWNGFGLSEGLNENKSNNITVEINIPTNGINRRVAGLFVRNEDTNALLLMHKGKIGGGRKGIGKKSFLGWYNPPMHIIYDDNNETENAFLIGEIESNKFASNLTAFIKSVSEFKFLATTGVITEATYLTDEDLKLKINDYSSSKKPKKKKTSITTYSRNPYIAEYAKRRASGKCQLCSGKAPFKNKSGKPYLETHHIIWLSKNGDDSINNTVALCPNCHRKMHSINLSKDIKRLIRQAKST